jgi:hypothetical protein
VKVKVQGAPRNNKRAPTRAAVAGPRPHSRCFEAKRMSEMLTAKYDAPGQDRKHAAGAAAARRGPANGIDNRDPIVHISDL